MPRDSRDGNGHSPVQRNEATPLPRTIKVPLQLNQLGHLTIQAIKQVKNSVREKAHHHRVKNDGKVNANLCPGTTDASQVVHPQRTVIPDKGEVDAEVQLHLNCQHSLGKTLASSGPLLYFSLKELQHDTTGPRVKRLTGSWIVLVEKPWSLCCTFDLSVITRF